MIHDGLKKHIIELIVKQARLQSERLNLDLRLSSLEASLRRIFEGIHDQKDVDQICDEAVKLMFEDE